MQKLVQREPGHREGRMLTDPPGMGRGLLQPPPLPLPQRGGLLGGGTAKSCTGKAARTKMPWKTPGPATPVRAPVGTKGRVTDAATGCREVGARGSTVTLDSRDCAGVWPSGKGTWWPPWGARGQEASPGPSGLSAQPFRLAFPCSPVHRAALEWGGRGKPPVSP